VEFAYLIFVSLGLLDILVLALCTYDNHTTNNSEIKHDKYEETGE
jgi:hypothetical protein